MPIGDSITDDCEVNGAWRSFLQPLLESDGYFFNIVRDALALTNNRPDLVLLLIGANDIGRGRDPNYVATNDMPNLLDLIFSNVPNANIILAKITSLQNANISGQI